VIRVSVTSPSRRVLIAALGSAAALPWLHACARQEKEAPDAPASREADARALLDQCADRLLALLPESATSLGVDTGQRAALRSQLADRSAAGTRRLAEQVRADLARVNAFDVSGLPHDVRTSLEVVRSAYATALEGFALPYGDVTVGSWRNTPYVVIQNVGAYLDIPRFLCNRSPGSSMASSGASRRRAAPGCCRPPFSWTRRSPSSRSR
jgi:uncharacterized protein (DUF885 family)